MLSRFINSNFIKRSASIATNFFHTRSEVSNGVPPVITSWIYKETEKIITPPIFNNKIILPNLISSNFPFGNSIDGDCIINRYNRTLIEPPLYSNDCPKEAARLIVIRRKKMKKHKLRKLRKRMKFEWAKLRQKREFRKEKIFQANLIQQCKQAESFSAEKYVEEKLNKLHEVVIPRYWKGKRLPEFLIRQKMGFPYK